MPRADETASVETLEQIGARLRRRKSGRVHTVDYRPIAAEVDDSHLAPLEGLYSLVELYLSGTSIGDDVLPLLASHPQLETLDLQDTRVGDKVFQLAHQLPALKVLVLSGTAVTLEEIRLQRSQLLQVRIVHLA